MDLEGWILAGRCQLGSVLGGRRDGQGVPGSWYSSPTWQWSCAPGRPTPGARSGWIPGRAAGAVVAGWQRGDLPSLRLGELTGQEVLAVQRPAMTYVRAQFGDRLQRQLARASRRR